VKTLDVAVLRAVMAELDSRGFAGEVAWAEQCTAPTNANDFAAEIVFVIVNSGMKNSVAAPLYHEKIKPTLLRGGSASEVFGHKGKSAAMDRVWRDRQRFFAIWNACRTDDERIAFLGGLPWIGNITKYHAARNFGVDCVKPDRHIERLAEHHGETPHKLCSRLSRQIGVRVGAIDAILWRACEQGIIDSRSGEVRIAHVGSDEVRGAARSGATSETSSNAARTTP
jgi:hypothetical protein